MPGRQILPCLLTALVLAVIGLVPVWTQQLLLAGLDRVWAGAIAVLRAAIFKLPLKATSLAGWAAAMSIAIARETAGRDGTGHLLVEILLVPVLGMAVRLPILRTSQE